MDKCKNNIYLIRFVTVQILPLLIFSSFLLYAKPILNGRSNTIADIEAEFKKHKVNYDVITRDGRRVLQLQESPETTLLWVRLANGLMRKFDIPFEIDIVIYKDTKQFVFGKLDPGRTGTRIFFHPNMVMELVNREVMVIHEFIHFLTNYIVITTAKPTVWSITIFPSQELLPPGFPEVYSKFFRVDEILAYLRSLSQFRLAKRKLKPEFHAALDLNIKMGHQKAKLILEASITHLKAAIEELKKRKRQGQDLLVNPGPDPIEPHVTDPTYLVSDFSTAGGSKFSVAVVQASNFKGEHILRSMERTLETLKMLKIDDMSSNCREVMSKIAQQERQRGIKK